MSCHILSENIFPVEKKKKKKRGLLNLNLCEPGLASQESECTLDSWLFLFNQPGLEFRKHLAEEGKKKEESEGKKTKGKNKTKK